MGDQGRRRLGLFFYKKTELCAYFSVPLLFWRRWTIHLVRIYSSSTATKSRENSHIPPCMEFLWKTQHIWFPQDQTNSKPSTEIPGILTLSRQLQDFPQVEEFRCNLTRNIPTSCHILTSSGNASPSETLSSQFPSAALNNNVLTALDWSESKHQAQQQNLL